MMVRTQVLTYLRRLIVVLLTILPLYGVARMMPPTTAIQYPTDNSLDNSSGLSQSDLIDRDTSDQKKKPRKPLESFYFDDSTRNQRIFSWTTSMENNNVTMQEMDTTIAGFQKDYTFMREGVGSASLGNLGGATTPLNWLERPQFRNFSFMQSWSEYLMTPEKIRFYNAKMPYSNISYQMSGQRANEEQIFHAIISQNISPSSSININYNAEGTKGHYERQRRWIGISRLTLLIPENDMQFTVDIYIM